MSSWQHQVYYTSLLHFIAQMKAFLTTVSSISFLCVHLHYCSVHLSSMGELVRTDKWFAASLRYFTSTVIYMETFVSAVDLSLLDVGIMFRLTSKFWLFVNIESDKGKKFAFYSQVFQCSKNNEQFSLRTCKNPKHPHIWWILPNRSQQSIRGQCLNTFILVPSAVYVFSVCVWPVCVFLQGASWWAATKKEWPFATSPLARHVQKALTLQAPSNKPQSKPAGSAVSVFMAVAPWFISIQCSPDKNLW